MDEMSDKITCTFTDHTQCKKDSEGIYNCICNDCPFETEAD